MKKIFIILIIPILTTSCAKELQCEEGYFKKDNLCYKEIARTNANETYICNKPYTLNPKTNKCEQLIEVEPEISYTCNKGFTLNNNKCSGNDTINANINYNCNGIGGTLSGNKCIQTVVDTQARVCDKYACLSGTYDTDLKKCKSVAPFTGNVSYSNPVCVSYSCIRGTLKNNVCYLDYASNANFTYSCNNGYTLNGSLCYKYITINAKETKTCPDTFSLKNQTCQKILETEKLLNYTCEENYILEGKECIQYDIKKGTYK